MVVKVLQALSVLVKFGYYDDSKDVNDLLPSLQKLLNGKDDFPSKRIKELHARELVGGGGAEPYHVLL